MDLKAILSKLEAGIHTGQGASAPQSHSDLGAIESPIHLLACCLGGGIKTWRTWMNRREKAYTDNNQSSGSNLELWDVKALTAVPQYCLGTLSCQWWMLPGEGEALGIKYFFWCLAPANIPQAVRCGWWSNLHRDAITVAHGHISSQAGVPSSCFSVIDRLA